MIRILTLYVVPISFAIILLIGLVGNTLVIFVVSYHIIVIMVTIIIIGMEVTKIALYIKLILNLAVIIKTFVTINDYDDIIVFDITMMIIFFDQVMANPQMKNTTNLLILNLAVADLLFVLVCVPFTASDYVLM